MTTRKETIEECISVIQHIGDPFKKDFTDFGTGARELQTRVVSKLYELIKADELNMNDPDIRDMLMKYNQKNKK